MIPASTTDTGAHRLVRRQGDNWCVLSAHGHPSGVRTQAAAMGRVRPARRRREQRRPSCRRPPPRRDAGGSSHEQPCSRDAWPVSRVGPCWTRPNRSKSLASDEPQRYMAAHELARQLQARSTSSAIPPSSTIPRLAATTSISPRAGCNLGATMRRWPRNPRRRRLALDDPVIEAVGADDELERAQSGCSAAGTICCSSPRRGPSPIPPAPFESASTRWSPKRSTAGGTGERVGRRRDPLAKRGSLQLAGNDQGRVMASSTIRAWPGGTSPTPWRVALAFGGTVGPSSTSRSTVRTSRSGPELRPVIQALSGERSGSALIVSRIPCWRPGPAALRSSPLRRQRSCGTVVGLDRLGGHRQIVIADYRDQGPRPRYPVAQPRMMFRGPRQTPRRCRPSPDPDGRDAPRNWAVHLPRAASGVPGTPRLVRAPPCLRRPARRAQSRRDADTSGRRVSPERRSTRLRRLPLDGGWSAAGRPAGEIKSTDQTILPLPVPVLAPHDEPTGRWLAARLIVRTH